VEWLPLIATDVANATRGRVVRGDPATAIDRVSIDSRSLEPGDFFVAIAGDKFDGHRFVDDAARRGAIGAMVHQAPVSPEAGKAMPALVIQVEDTTRALQDLARDVRRRSGAMVVAITGSAGKTTTKEVVAEFLSVRFPVFRNKGNLNNHIGLPLSLLQLRSKPRIAVVELGMNHTGEIRTLVGIAEPEVRVWTNVGDAHLGFFASAEAIADAKAEILENSAPSHLLVANANDPRVMERARRFTGRLMTFGIDVDADVRASSVVHRGVEGMEAVVSAAGREARLRTPLLGLGNLSNVLAAIAVGLHVDISLDDMVARAATLAPAYHRGEVLRLPGGVTLIDDSYNSSPAALGRALETMASASGSARKVGVLGEMLELGEFSEALHREAGRRAAAAGLDLLIGVGGSVAAAMTSEAVLAGMPERCVWHVSSKEEAADLALRHVRAGDLVLVKGSRGIGTDLVVERLKGEFA
jgi:UDP-N-acetylmuramoyl-tripeptide--D-alanyl-D-alanine ligase